jgi:hypothetical protein
MKFRLHQADMWVSSLVKHIIVSLSLLLYQGLVQSIWTHVEHHTVDCACPG